MNKRYKILLRIIFVEIFIAFVLNKIEIRAVSWISNAIGLFIAFLPIEILLFSISKDKKIKKIWRIISGFYFIFIIFVYAISGITKLAM